MKELRFYGASDDCFECEGAIREEINCYNTPGIYHLKSSEGELQVVGMYLNNGCWSIGIAPVEEGSPIPAWPTSFSVRENGYSAVLTISVPDDTELVMEEDL